MWKIYVVTPKMFVYNKTKLSSINIEQNGVDLLWNTA